MADVKKTLPPSTGAAQGICAVLDSCDTELDLLEQEARAACLRLAAGTADAAGCTLWERELGLEVREDLPTEVRRALIAVALEGRETCTPQRLKALLDRMLEGGAELTEHFAEYRLELTAQVEQFHIASLGQVAAVLRQAVPAHLEIGLHAAAGLQFAPAPGWVNLSAIGLEIVTEEEEV